MATKNAINTGSPIEVTSGGTAAATLTDHSVLIGSGTAAITPITVGTTGQILTATTSADPSFASSSNGDFTFGASTAGATRVLKAENTDNTNTSSTALLSISTGGSSAGDPALRQVITSVRTWSQGVDNSDSDKFKISASTSLGVSDVFIVTSSGEITKPLQPAFGATASDQTDVTGGGTVYTVVFSTEYFDQNGDFDGTSTFTAPVTGKYVFNGAITYSGVGTEPYVQIRLNTSNRLYNPGVCSIAAKKDASNRYTAYATFVVDMDVSDTAKIDAYVWSTGSDDVDILGAGTFFNGYLAC